MRSGDRPGLQTTVWSLSPHCGDDAEQKYFAAETDQHAVPAVAISQIQSSELGHEAIVANARKVPAL